jgi:hypothetical protein
MEKTVCKTATTIVDTFAKRTEREEQVVEVFIKQAYEFNVGLASIKAELQTIKHLSGVKKLLKEWDTNPATAPFYIPKGYKPPMDAEEEDAEEDSPRCD